MATGVSKKVLLPCYSPTDFKSAGTRVGLSGYQRWRTAAQRELARHLAAGFAVELVCVRRCEFNAWLAENDLEDDLQARLDYVRTADVARRRTVGLTENHAMRRRALAS